MEVNVSEEEGSRFGIGKTLDPDGEKLASPQGIYFLGRTQLNVLGMRPPPTSIGLEFHQQAQGRDTMGTWTREETAGLGDPCFGLMTRTMITVGGMSFAVLYFTPG
jgi:hypothetical protein